MTISGSVLFFKDTAIKEWKETTGLFFFNK